MNEQARQIRERAARLKTESKNADDALSKLEENCDHKYKEPVYEPYETGGYRCEGDPPGTMSVDRQLPFYVPREVHKRWKRECDLCGRVEYTTSIRTETRENPRWPGDSE